MASIEEKQRALAKLLGMANQQIGEINASSRFGGNDGNKVTLAGISRHEFIDAITNVDKMSSTGMRVAGPRSNSDPSLPPIGPDAEVTTDTAVVLQSIYNTLRDIYALLMEVTGRGGGKIEPVLDTDENQV